MASDLTECMAVVRALAAASRFRRWNSSPRSCVGEIPRSKHAGSMALDIARGVLTEIDKMIGFIARQGERLNMPVSNCRAVYRLVKGLELAAQSRVVNPR